MRSGRPRARAAFTMVEMLIVVGIIALLFTILVPVLTRTREMSRRLQCMGNLRGISLAMLSLVADDGKFPGPAVDQRPDDWIFWHPGRNLEQGKLVKYLGGRFDPSWYRCPSDQNWVNRPEMSYTYSYTVNEKICGYYQPSLRLNQIARPAEIMLVMDESSDTVDDGCWAPQNYAGDAHNLMSNRHARQSELRYDPNAGRGNVAFADGHADFIERRDSFNPRAYDPKLP